MGIFITISIIATIISLVLTFMSAKKYEDITYSPAVLSFIILCVGVIFFSDIEIIEKIITIAIFVVLLAITKSVWGKIEKDRELIEKKVNGMQVCTPKYLKKFHENLDVTIASLIGLGAAGIFTTLANSSPYFKQQFFSNLNKDSISEAGDFLKELFDEVKNEINDMNDFVAYNETQNLQPVQIPQPTQNQLRQPVTSETLWESQKEAIKKILVKYVMTLTTLDTNISFLKENKLLADSNLHPVGIILNFAYTVGSVACIFLLPAIL